MAPRADDAANRLKSEPFRGRFARWLGGRLQDLGYAIYMWGDKVGFTEDEWRTAVEPHLREELSKHGR